MQEDARQVSSHKITNQTPAKVELLNKRGFSETIQMQLDGEQSISKRMKITQVKDIIDLDEEAHEKYQGGYDLIEREKGEP